MRKEEFLEKLRARLSQTMSQQEVTAQIRFYENYIQEQMQNGRSEEEVLTELGDPLLIAKTLMEVQETKEEYNDPVGSRDSAYSSAPDIDPVNDSFIGCGIF